MPLKGVYSKIYIYSSLFSSSFLFNDTICTREMNVGGALITNVKLNDSELK